MRALDLCSGIGGFRVGAGLSNQADDFEFVAYSDLDPYANKAYAAMFGASNEVCLEDIQRHTRFDHELELTGLLPDHPNREQLINDAVPDFDFLFAGFPCQPHSLMGNRQGTSDMRGNIFYDIVELLRTKQPEYFLLENVKAITSVNDGAFFREIKEILEVQLGYHLRIWTLNASDYGVPQTRRRVFFAGSRDRLLPRTPPCNANITPEFMSTWHLLEREVDNKYFLSEKILQTILKHEHKGYKRKAEINQLIARPLCKSMHKMHRASQDNYYSEDFINGTYDEETRSVVALPIPNPRIRRITPREALRIQSFPEEMVDSLINSGLSDTRVYMLAGNAVPPLLVKSVINHMFS